MSKKYIEVKTINLPSTKIYYTKEYPEKGLYLVKSDDITETSLVYVDDDAVFYIGGLGTVEVNGKKICLADKLNVVDSPTNIKTEIERKTEKEIDKEFILQVIATTLGNKKV